MVFYGPSDGFSVYFNGVLIASDFDGPSVDLVDNSGGNVILGKEAVNKDKSFADVTVDELYFWNQPLGAAVIQELYNSC